MSEEGWVKVNLEVEASEIELATMLLWDEGASGVEVQDDETFLELQPHVPHGKARAIAWFGNEPAETVQQRLQAACQGYSLTPTSLDAAPFTDESWKHDWKQFFKPRRISARLAVRPPWEEASFEGAHTLIIEPGMAFGTGTHATTQLCLTWLDDLCGAQEPLSMIDVGCGSGILSIGVARLTRHTTLRALDVDPEATRITMENARDNQVADRIQILSGLLDKVSEPATLVVANILAHILIRLRDDLIRVTAPGGKLLLSGIGEDDEASVRDAFQEAGCSIEQRRQQEGWVALLLTCA